MNVMRGRGQVPKQPNPKPPPVKPRPTTTNQRSDHGTNREVQR